MKFITKFITKFSNNPFKNLLRKLQGGIYIIILKSSWLISMLLFRNSSYFAKNKMLTCTVILCTFFVSVVLTFKTTNFSMQSIPRKVLLQVRLYDYPCTDPVEDFIVENFNVEDFICVYTQTNYLQHRSVIKTRSA